jgi:hypothetical protein
MDRPYCFQELKDIEAEIHSKYRLSDVFASHFPCLHRYRVKKGGRKEQYILSNDSPIDNNLIDQTCSICFKLRVGVNKQNDQLPWSDVIEEIQLKDGITKELDINYLKNKNSFYRWLFQHDY